MTLFSKKNAAIAALIGLALPAFAPNTWAKGSAVSEQTIASRHLSHPHATFVNPRAGDHASPLPEGRSFSSGASTPDEKGFLSGDPENPRMGD